MLWPLYLAALTQALLAVVNLFLVPLMHWQPVLDETPVLFREVFQVHSWFISITLGIFSVITFRFAEELAAGSNEALTWMAGGIATLWSVRFALQWVFYSWSHWLGHLRPTIMHVGCCLVYGSWAVVYWLAVARGLDR